MKDEILKEVWATKDRIAEKYRGNIKKFMGDLRKSHAKARHSKAKASPRPQHAKRKSA